MKGIVGICVGPNAFSGSITSNPFISLEKLDVQIGYLIAVLIAACVMTLAYVEIRRSQQRTGQSRQSDQ